MRFMNQPVNPKAKAKALARLFLGLLLVWGLQLALISHKIFPALWAFPAVFLLAAFVAALAWYFYALPITADTPRAFNCRGATLAFVGYVCFSGVALSLLYLPALYGFVLATVLVVMGLVTLVYAGYAFCSPAWAREFAARFGYVYTEQCLQTGHLVFRDRQNPEVTLTLDPKNLNPNKLNPKT